MAGFSSLGRLFESFDKNQPQFCVLSPVPASNGLFWHEKAFATLQGQVNYRITRWSVPKSRSAHWALNRSVCSQVENKLTEEDSKYAQR